MELLPLLLATGLVAFFTLSFLYSGLETATVSVNDALLQQRATDGDRRAAAAIHLLRDRQRLLAITLVGTNLANVSVALLGERLLDVFWPTIESPFFDLLVITPLLLVLAEILPKHLFYVHSMAILPRALGFLRASALLFVPVVAFCSLCAGLLARPFGVRLDRTAFRRRVSVDDIRALIGASEAGGSIPRGERLMIDRILDLQDTMVREIMKPLVDVVAVRLHGTSIEDFKRLARETGHSRFPVFAESIVHLEGYIDIYDVLTGSDPHARLADFVRRGHVVPETVRVDALLTELLRLREPAAIVIDEHGGSVGWVTLEDVIEEIVGEIEDEFDTEAAPVIQRIDDDTIIVPASLDIDDFNRITGDELPSEEDFDTIAGLIHTRLGRVAEVGDVVVDGALKLRVLSMEGRKISKVRITRLERERGGADATDTGGRGGGSAGSGSGGGSGGGTGPLTGGTSTRRR